MKNIKNISIKLLALIGLSFMAGCSLFNLDNQKNYEYDHFVLDNQLHMTAWDYLKSRANGNPSNPTDTVFKWMKKAIDYCGIDTMEYMKPDRTYIFLQNDALMGISSGKVSRGFFFDFPIVTSVDGTGLFKTTTPATQWSQYSKQTVKNYLLYLIIKGNYNFNNFVAGPNIYETLLPAGTVATRESKLGFLVTPATIPGFTDGKTTTAATFTYSTAGTGFDPEGKINIQLGNTSDSKIFLGGYNVVRSSGYYADNGSIHVWGTTVFPTR
ncbi:MAG: hypothetical protein V4592_23405 [Bacteroidota bacterium]